MGSDEDVDGPVVKVRQNLLPFLSRRPTGQKRDADVEVLKKAEKLFIMLSCQNACRRHQRPLVAVFNDLCQSQGGDDGFPRADIPLNEALHRNFTFHIVLNV